MEHEFIIAKAKRMGPGICTGKTYAMNLYPAGSGRYRIKTISGQEMVYEDIFEFLSYWAEITGYDEVNDPVEIMRLAEKHKCVINYEDYN